MKLIGSLFFIVILLLMISSVNAVDVNETADSDICLEASDVDCLDSIDDENIIGDSPVNKNSDGRFDVKISDENIINHVGIEVEMPKYLPNNLTMNIDDEYFRNFSSKEVMSNDGYFTLDLSNYTLGKHKATFIYNDDDFSFFKQATLNLTLVWVSIPNPIIDDDTDEMGPSIFVFEQVGLNENFYIYIDDKFKSTYSYSEYDIEGYYVGNLKYGSHKIKVTYSHGNYNYSHEETVDVYYPFSIRSNLIYGEQNYIRIYVPDKLQESKLKVLIDGKNYKYTKSNDYLKINDLNLALGTHTVTVCLSNGKVVYKSYVNVRSKINLPTTYDFATQADQVTLNLPKNAKGELWIDIGIYDGNELKEYDRVKIPLIDGKATFSFKNLPVGKKFNIDCYYTGDDYKVRFASRSYEIVKPVLSGAKNVNMHYSDGTTFKVKVTDSSGNILVAAPVTIKINGKVVDTVKTNYNGFAIYKITQIPKKYKITAEYGNVKITKKLTVKQILTLKKIKIRKNAKKLVLTATLKKIKGKYLKGKKITFKFNGKKYVAKTNKKGIAKVTIKKNTLKKLKKNKVVKYQATYIKDTVKRTGKVK